MQRLVYLLFVGGSLDEDVSVEFLDLLLFLVAQFLLLNLGEEQTLLRLVAFSEVIEKEQISRILRVSLVLLLPQQFGFILLDGLQIELSDLFEVVDLFLRFVSVTDHFDLFGSEGLSFRGELLYFLHFLNVGLLSFLQELGEEVLVVALRSLLLVFLILVHL